MRPIYEVRFAIEEEFENQFTLRKKLDKVRRQGKLLETQWLIEELENSMNYLQALDTELTEMVRRKHNERETVETFLKNYAA